jgi:alanyl-tRNA synthetase
MDSLRSVLRVCVSCVCIVCVRVVCMQLVDVVVKNFGGFFPELVTARDTIFNVISDEETSFGRTLVKGIERFKKVAEAVKAQGNTLVRVCVCACVCTCVHVCVCVCVPPSPHLFTG